MKIGIIGIGSIGGLIAGLIGNTKKHELVLFTNTEIQKLELITNGLTIKMPLGNSDLKLNQNIFSIYSKDELPNYNSKKCDLVLICTKSNSTLNAAEITKGIISNEGHCISIQNGIGNENIISSIIGFNSVLGGVITHGANRINSTIINWAGIGELFIGCMPLTKIKNENIEEIIDVLNDSGLNASFISDIRSKIWLKLAINAAVNPLASICGVKNGALLEPLLFESACSAMFEVLNVARELEIQMPDNFEMIEILSNILKTTSENRCSMLQDIMNGKTTEIDSICGEVIRKAEMHGIQTPINSILMAIITGITSTNTN